VRTSYAIGSRTGVAHITVKHERIVPVSAGADALVVRDYLDRYVRFRVTESGVLYCNDIFLRAVAEGAFYYAFSMRYYGLDIGPGNIAYVKLYVTDIPSYAPKEVITLSRGNPPTITIRTGDRVDSPISIQSHDGSAFVELVRLVGGRMLLPRGFTVTAPPATSTVTLQNSPPAALRGTYWDGVASRDRDAVVIHRMLSTTPTSEIAFQIAGVDYMRVGDRGVRIDRVVFDPGSSVSVAAGEIYTLGVGVWYVNLGANTVAEVYDDVAGAWVTVIPAGGKGIVISDGSNARLRNTGISAESSNIRRVL
jgi:hypothetical protein